MCEGAFHFLVRGRDLRVSAILILADLEDGAKYGVVCGVSPLTLPDAQEVIATSDNASLALPATGLHAMPELA